MITIPSNNDKRIVWAGDIILVTGDALIALFVQDWFYDNFYMTSGPQSNQMLPTLMSIAVFLITALYVYALLSNLKNIENLPPRPASKNEWMALAFNTMLFSAIFSLNTRALFNFESNVILIILVIIFMALWYWLHYKVFNAAGKDGKGCINKTAQIKGIILLAPLALVSFMPTNAIATIFKDVLADLSVTDIIWQTAVFSLILSILSWIMVYIPRRMIGIISGNTYRNRFFFILLWLGTILKIFF